MPMCCRTQLFTRLFVDKNNRYGCNCCILNARSIVNKLPELHYLLYNNNYSVICITETWLHSEITNGLLDPQAIYHIIRKDRVGSHHGGVAVFIKKDMCFVDITVDRMYDCLELLCFEVVFSKCKVRFFVIYRPPYYDQSASDYIDLLIRCVKQYSSTERHTINVVVGDLNCPKIDWQNLSSSNDYISTAVLRWAVMHGYFQFVDFPTRGDNILDLVLADDNHIISRIYCDPPLGYSDHCIVNFVLDIIDNFRHISLEPYQSGSSVAECRYNWHTADYDVIARYICNIDWNTLLCYNPSALSFWNAFMEILWSAVENFVPKINGTRKVNHKSYPREMRKLIAKKRQLHNQCRLNPDNLHMRWQYRNLVSKFKDKCHDLEKQHEEQIISANSLGLFYKYVNGRIRYRSAIGALTTNTGDIVTSEKDKADMFNEFFANAGTKDNGKVPFCHNVALKSTLETVTFTEDNILSVINKLKPNLSSGPDCLPPVFFKNLKLCLAGPLSIVFNQLISVGAVPNKWKSAIIVPVFKKGPAGDVANYRPISLTCVPCKLMERIIAQHIYDHLVDCNLLSSAQHGFVKRRSTCTNLLESVNDWTLAADNKKSVTIAYIDFTRAFDCVSHNKLLARLQSYGICGSVLTWLKNFFSDRSHVTRVGEYLSDVADLISGVVQGSGIGPIMFLVYIDELAKLLKNHGVVAKLFADDVKVYVNIVSSDDVTKLQTALNLIVEWAASWQLQLSVSKCCILSVGRALAKTDYNIGDTVLPYGTKCRDLGVMITQDLSPAVHINEITAKAHQRANCILRCFVSKDINLLMRAFLVYVRPVVEYCSVIWSPCLKQDIESIEKVQRRFTKRLKGLKSMTYAQRLQYLSIPSLELRRLHLDLLFCYKIVFGLVDINFSDFFEFCPSNRTRGHAHKLFKSHCNSCVRSQFFAERVVKVWNSLPPTTDFATLPAFKQSIMDVDFSAFLKVF